MDPKNTEVSQAPNSQADAKPQKEKKPRTEAQKAATQKALAAMTAKRKEIIDKKKEVKEKVKQAKKVVEEKIIKEDLGFVLKNDFESRLGSLTKELAEVRALYAVAKEHAEKPAAKPVERIVERVVEKPIPVATPTPTKLTGHALLDRVFGFEK